MINPVLEAPINCILDGVSEDVIADICLEAFAGDCPDCDGTGWVEDGQCLDCLGTGKREPEHGEPGYQSGSKGPEGAWGDPSKDWLPNPPRENPQRIPDEAPTDYQAGIPDYGQSPVAPQGYDPNTPDDEPEPLELEPPEQAAQVQMLRDLLGDDGGSDPAADKAAQQAAEFAAADDHRRSRTQSVADRLRWSKHKNGDFAQEIKGKAGKSGEVAGAAISKVGNLLNPSGPKYRRNVKYLKWMAGKMGTSVANVIGLMGFLRQSGVGSGVSEL